MVRLLCVGELESLKNVISTYKTSINEEGKNLRRCRIRRIIGRRLIPNSKETHLNIESYSESSLT